jgi:hypothetical protein
MTKSEQPSQFMARPPVGCANPHLRRHRERRVTESLRFPRRHQRPRLRTHQIRAPLVQPRHRNLDPTRHIGCTTRPRKRQQVRLRRRRPHQQPRPNRAGLHFRRDLRRRWWGCSGECFRWFDSGTRNGRRARWRHNLRTWSGTRNSRRSLWRGHRCEILRLRSDAMSTAARVFLIVSIIVAAAIVVAAIALDYNLAERIVLAVLACLLVALGIVRAQRSAAKRRELNSGPTSSRRARRRWTVKFSEE